MSIIGKRLTELRQTGNQLKPVSHALPQMQMINGRLIGYDDNIQSYITNGYNVNDIIYSIVNLITDKVKIAPFGLYTIQDEQAYKQLNALKSKKDLTALDYNKVLALQSKALAPVKNGGKWAELLKYPNETETFNEFVGNGVAFKLLTGNRYILGKPLKEGLNKGVPYDLRNLPPQIVSIYSSNTFPANAVGYYIPVWAINYLPTEVAHDKYFNPNWQVNGSELYGMSPLRAALLRLKKNNSLTEAEASTFQNEGIKGIMFMRNRVGNVDGELVLPEVRKLKESLMTEWSGAHNRGRIGISGYEMGYEAIGMTSEEMEIINSTYLDLRFFCNIYGVPSQLMNDPESRTYNTQKEVEKALTNRCAIPRLNETKNLLNRKGSLEWGLPAGTVIDYDISCYPELQADVKETSEWTNNLIVQIPDEQRELCGLAATGDPELSKPWVKSGAGYVPLADFQAGQEMAAALNERDLDGETEETDETQNEDESAGNFGGEPDN